MSVAISQPSAALSLHNSREFVKVLEENLERFIETKNYSCALSLLQDFDISKYKKISPVKTASILSKWVEAAIYTKPLGHEKLIFDLLEELRMLELKHPGSNEVSSYHYLALLYSKFDKFIFSSEIDNNEYVDFDEYTNVLLFTLGYIQSFKETAHMQNCLGHFYSIIPSKRESSLKMFKYSFEYYNLNQNYPGMINCLLGKAYTLFCMGQIRESQMTIDNAVALFREYETMDKEMSHPYLSSFICLCKIFCWNEHLKVSKEDLKKETEETISKLISSDSNYSWVQDYYKYKLDSFK